MKVRHELLSPAGSYEIAKAVIDAGADAVYLAGNLFGARAYAGNLSQEELFSILDYAHVRGASIHLTVNTLLKNKEITERLYGYLLPLYERGLDAVIVQDFGVLDFLHRNFPELSLHASTQMSVADTAGAEFLKQQGVSRIVTARELSLKEICRIAAIPDLEVETFIHGALCVCYSGQCLMSSMIGGRSGNRGRCAQPCRLAHRVSMADRNPQRWEKEQKYPLSPKDLCTLSLLPELCRAGISSFKIEGRMKQKEYAAGVTGIYRRYLDLFEADPEHYRVDKADERLLFALGNRSGFTDGYYHRHNGPEMMADRDSSHSSDRTVRIAVPERKKAPVDFYFSAGIGERMRLTAVSGEVVSERTGACAQKAKNQAATPESVRKQLAKTGSTPFVMREAGIFLEGDLYVPIRDLNELRRDVLEDLEKQKAGSFRREAAGRQPVLRSQTGADSAAAGTESRKSRDLHTLCRADSAAAGKEADRPALTVVVSGPEQLEAVLRMKTADRVLLDYPKNTSFEILKEEAARIHEEKAEAGYCFPYVFRSEFRDALTANREAWQACGFDRVLVRSYDSLGFCLGHSLIRTEGLMLDHGVYVYSTEAREAFSAAVSGSLVHTAPVELNEKELRHQNNRNAELIVYGRLPLMITAQCLYRNYDGCRRRESAGSRKKRAAGADGFFQNDFPAAEETNMVLTDRAGNRMPVYRDCAVCYNIIRQHRPLYLLDQAEAVRSMGFAGYRLMFTDESAEEVRRILEKAEGFRIGERIREEGEDFSGCYTHGHFKRGIL